MDVNQILLTFRTSMKLSKQPAKVPQKINYNLPGGLVVLYDFFSFFFSLAVWCSAATVTIHGLELKYRLSGLWFLMRKVHIRYT